MMDDSMPYSNIWKLNKTKCVCVGGGGRGWGRGNATPFVWRQKIHALFPQISFQIKIRAHESKN